MGLSNSYLAIQVSSASKVQEATQNQALYQELDRVLKMNNLQDQIKLEQKDQQIVLSPVHMEESQFLYASYYLAKSVVDSMAQDCENVQSVMIYIYDTTF